MWPGNLAKIRRNYRPRDPPHAPFPGEDELKLSEDEVGRAARFLTPESAGALRDPPHAPFPGEDELKLSEDEVGRAARFLTPESAGGSSLNFSLI